MDSPRPARSPARDRRALGDVLLIAALVLLPSVYASFESWFVARPPVPVAYTWLGLAVRALGDSVLGLFLIFRSGEPPATFGLTRPRVSDMFLGLALWLGVFVVIYGFAMVIPADLFGLPFQPAGYFFPSPQTPLDYTLVAVGSCVNGFGEEVVMRAVLQTRLERLMRSAPSAVLLTSILFALCHVYYGLVGVVQIWLFGLAVGIVFRLGKRLWPVVVVHAMQDFVPMLCSADAAK